MKLILENLNLRSAEVLLIQEALRSTSTIAAAAVLLGIPTSTLRSKMRRLGIQSPQKESGR